MVPKKMDAVETQSNSEVNDIPPVPIKTYHWEDVRRAKEKGAYPYTYLFKEPYDGEVDPEEYTMEAFRRSKSASTLGKSESGVVISEIIDDTKTPSKDYLDVGGMYKAEGIVESAESMGEDNISQYLDKDDDDRVQIKEHLEVPGPSTKREEDEEAEDKEEKMEVEEEKPEEEKKEDRAKSEEPKRKRKLSIESSYSRISLSRLGMMKKLKEAKDKIKQTFSKSDSKLDESKKPKKESTKNRNLDSKRESKKTQLEPKKIEGPLYIHIPLKPPPGQTDEFSYLEFEDPKNDDQKISTSTTPLTENMEGVESKEETKSDIQFIILTAPSDDETLEDHMMPDTPSAEGSKFFDDNKIKELKTLAKGVVDGISPDTKIDGIIFEDVIQVEYVDENNIPLATTENSKIIEVTQENLPTLERTLSKRNIRSLQKELRASRESLNKLVRQREREKQKEASKLGDNKDRSKEPSEEPVPPSDNGKTDIESEKTADVNGESATTKQDAKNNKELDLEAKTDLQTDDEKERAKGDKQKDETDKKTDSAVREKSVTNHEVQNKKEKTDKTKPVTDDTKSGKEEKQSQPESKILVDEEDGLKLSDEAVKLINEELAKENLPKMDEESTKSNMKPTLSLRKKVSFKRRSKQEDPDGIYEDVQVTSDASKEADGKEKGKELKVLDTSQSMSVDEEKTYLDDKIVKTTSLEEDYNKWSKIPDHEYEPINPPDDGKQQIPPPQVQITAPSADGDDKRTSSLFEGRSMRISLHEDVVVQSDDDMSGDALSAEEMQARIEDRFFNFPAQDPTTSTPEQSNVTKTTITTTTTTITTDGSKDEPRESQGKKIQAALKTQADKIRSKIRNITLPQRPKVERPKIDKSKIETPKLNLPKIPDQVKITLPFALPKMGTAKKRSLKERNFSTESNVGDSKKKLFDFSTYPRIFRKKKKRDDVDDDISPEVPEVSTVPRTTKNLVLGSRWGRKLTDKKKTEESRKSKDNETKKNPEVIRIPLHSDESMDRENFDDDVASHTRYNEDIDEDMDDAYLRENQEINRASPFSTDFSRNRWNCGSFHGENLNEIVKDSEYKVTDLDNDEESQSQPRTPPQATLDIRSTSSSGDVHRRGVLEEINPDEFFLREKGISQDDIEVGAYLSSEIRQAFSKPVNALSQMQADDEFDRDFNVSDHSLQEPPKRKPIKKPKRKKTPHVSQEQIPYDQESEPEEYPKPSEILPPRPKRKSKKKKKKEVPAVPYQETISIQETVPTRPQIVDSVKMSVSDNILNERCEDDRHFYDGDFGEDYPQMYENEHMMGIEQPNILISDPYHRQMFKYADEQDDMRYVNDLPEAPPRKQRSLKSLTSEPDSITDEIKYANQGVPQQNLEAYRLEHEYIIPTPEEPPVKPARMRSSTRSLSRTTQGDDDTSSRDDESQVPQQPCVEEPCVQTVCDYMGYAIIDKSKQREPPLPPPPRRRRSDNSSKSSQSETKFFTVPRSLNDDTPVRPLRNYSTLAPRTKRSSTNITDEEKENLSLSLSQYIEVEDDEHSRDLKSGVVVQKMKDRPLPAPPRPPRRHKDIGKPPLNDITHKDNVAEEELHQIKHPESEVSVQTEPLPDDFVCEELVQDKSDKVITPTSTKSQQPPVVTEYEHEETITHGALVVAPVPDSYQEGPLTSFSRSTERIITVKRERDVQRKPDDKYQEDETSEVPDEFVKLKNPPPRVVSAQPDSNTEVEVLRAQKLQVSDLDVNRLTVNELLAGKIRVSEIDSGNICVSEINPRAGNIIVSGVELPASFLQELVGRLHTAQERESPDVPKQFSQNCVPEKIREQTQLRTGIEKLPEPGKTAATIEDAVELKSEEAETKTKDSILPIKTQTASLTDESFLKDIEEQIIIENISPAEKRIIADFLTREDEREEEEDEDIPELIKREEVSAVTADFLTKQDARDKFEDVPELIKYDEASAITADPTIAADHRLTEELEDVSDEQKKTSFEDELDLGGPPQRPPRQSDFQRQYQFKEEILYIPREYLDSSEALRRSEEEEDTPPPRPPQPADILETVYLRSQPPPSFYTLRSPLFEDIVDDIPSPPRRRRQQKTLSRSRSSSDEAPPTPPRGRRHRTPEPSIPQLAGQLTRACGVAGDRALKRLIKYITTKVLQNADGRQDVHVIVVILLVLIAGLILLGWGDGKTIHYHHWEYFNPPRDM